MECSTEDCGKSRVHNQPLGRLCHCWSHSHSSASLHSYTYIPLHIGGKRYTSPIPILHTTNKYPEMKPDRYQLICKTYAGFHLGGGGGHSPPLKNLVPPLGNCNPSKLNTAHCTCAPPKCPLKCFCPPLEIFLNESLQYAMSMDLLTLVVGLRDGSSAKAVLTIPAISW